ncbi:ABC transporter substrate-binding protein [bacterium]|nr:ABC transporter substrate-binding protein [bacterium]
MKRFQRKPWLAACIVLLLCSCGKSNQRTNGTIDSSKPQYGGTIIYGKNGPPLTLDPAFTRETESSIIVVNIFDGLVEQRAGKVAIDPALAKSWKVSDDGKTYTFSLRTSVTFHDGTPFNADAVVYNFDRQRDPKHPSHFKDLDYDYWKNFNMDKIIKSIHAINDSTVEFVLNEPDATFLNILTLNFLGMVSPDALKKYGKDFSKNPVGTGAFRFLEWDASGNVVTLANEQFWGGRPFIDTLIFKPIPDAKQRWQMLKSGAINMMGVPDQSDITEIENTAGIKYSKQPGLNISYLAMNTSKKPFDNPKVREAIVLAIDRDKLVEKVFAQLGRSAKNPIPPSVLGYNEEIRFTLHDPAKARQLLAEAGLPNGFKCSLWTMPIVREYMPNGKLAAEIIQADLKEVGIETDIVMYSWDEFLRRRGNGEHDLTIAGWVGDAPDPHFFFYPLLDKSIAERKPSTNAAFYTGEAMHQLILKGKATSDPVERSSIYKKACEVFNKDLPWFTIAHSVTIVPMKENVMDFQLHSSSVRKFNKVWLKRM